MATILDFFNNLPAYLEAWATAYGTGLYVILFLIIFCETGLVVTPILPGDSLLFATGALVAHVSGLDIWLMILLLSVAAVLGDFVNYNVGKWFAPRVFSSEKEIRWLNRAHLLKTQEFFVKYGGKAIILARFVPIVRTYAPFVAGMGSMDKKKFLSYNVIGGIVWITSFTLLGFFFGNIPAVKKNFQYVILAIIVVSVLPIVYEFIKARRQRA